MLAENAGVMEESKLWIASGFGTALEENKELGWKHALYTFSVRGKKILNAV